MRKALAIVLSLFMLLSLAGCVELDMDDLKEPVTVTPDDNSEESTTTEQFDEPEATIEEVVLVDEAGVKITAKSLNMESLFGPEVKLLIENNSGKNLTFQSRSVSVNGYMVNTMMSVDVADGKKANDSLTFMESDFEICGIDEIADIELSFHIFCTEDWETYLDTDLLQMKTSIADTYTYTYDDSGDLAYEGNGVKIVVKGLQEDDGFFGPSIVVYVENTSSQSVTVQARDISINGFMVDPMFSCEVSAGKRAVDTVTFMETDLEENEITSIENVELSFHIFETDGWDTIVDTEVVAIDF